VRDAGSAADRAAAVFAPLAPIGATRSRAGALAEPSHLAPLALWPATQLLHAHVAAAAAGLGGRPESVAARLVRYRRGAGWSTQPLVGRRYYDDVAWLGLAALAARRSGRVGPWAQLAARASAFTLRGERPGGGVAWRVGGRAVHACSTGAAGLLAAGLGGPAQVAFARRCLAALDGPLRLPGGLVADHRHPDGRREETMWSYNQGLAIALTLAVGAGTPAQRVAAAAARAAAVVEALPLDVVWLQPPAFVAIFGRALVALGDADGDPAWGRYLDAYRHRVWSTARVGRWCTGGGIGAYDDGRVLDQSGLSQLFTLATLAPHAAAQVC